MPRLRVDSEPNVTAERDVCTRLHQGADEIPESSFYGPRRRWLAPDTLPAGLSNEDSQSALESLRGRVLREEVWSLDDAGNRHQLLFEIEYAYLVHPIPGVRNEAAFVVTERESMCRRYEGSYDDPRVTHRIALDCDNLGFVTRQATLAYPRRTPIVDAQARTLVFIRESDVAHHTDSHGATDGILTECRLWQLDGFDANDRHPVSAAALRRVPAAIQRPVAISDSNPDTIPRLIARQRTRFWNDASTAMLPYGEVGARVRPAQSEQLALDAPLLEQVYGQVPLDGALPFDEAGYMLSDGGWWVVVPATTDSPPLASRVLDDLFCDPIAHESSVPRSPCAQEAASFDTIVAETLDPMGRPTRIDLPAGTFRRTQYESWRRVEWDENDTVLQSQWYLDHNSSRSDENHRRAARLAKDHANTPTVVHLDGFGREVERVEDCGNGESCRTHIACDLLGRRRRMTDARGIDTESLVADLRGRVIQRISADAGRQTHLWSADDRLLMTWRGGGLRIRNDYDPRGRLVRRWVRNRDSAEWLAELVVYGLNNRVHQHFDGAGVVTYESYDRHGNPSQWTRQLPIGGEPPDWTLLARHATPLEIAAAARDQLDDERFTCRAEYDVTGLLTRLEHPDGTELIYTYSRSDHLDSVAYQSTGMARPAPLVLKLETNERGQRRRAVFANGVSTTYAYEPGTSRLARIETRRDGSARLQSLSYTYDAAGNIVQLNRHEPGAVTETQSYAYDGLYRLVDSHGREQCEFGPADDHKSASRDDHQRLTFDQSGNLLSMDHQSAETTLQRLFHVDRHSNRLLATTEAESATARPRRHCCTYDERGNMTSTPSVRHLEWTHRDQIRSMQLANERSAHCVYDAHGTRVRHTVVGPDQTEVTIRIGGWQIDRKRTGGKLVFERTRLHVSEGARPLAVLESATVENGQSVNAPAPRAVYQHDNHLGCVTMEVDQMGRVVRRRAFHPYGTLAWSDGDGHLAQQGEAGRDDSDLSLRGARFYSPKLGRWLSCDPAGTLDGPNPYAYVNNRVVNMHDPTGLYGEAGHYYTLYFTSLHAGFDPDVAYRNAFYGQMTDEVYDLDAVPVHGHVLRDEATLKDATDDEEIRRNVQLGLHALTGIPSNQETEFREKVLRNLTPGTPIFGMALHAFGDSYSHRIVGNESKMYNPKWGHFKHSLLPNKNPDAIALRPDLYIEYARHLYRILLDLVSPQSRQPLAESTFVSALRQVSSEPDEASQIVALRQQSNSVHSQLGHGITMPNYAPEDFGGDKHHYGYSLAGLESENLMWDEYYLGNDMNPHWPVGDRQAAGAGGMTLSLYREIGRQWRFQNSDYDGIPRRP